MFDDAAPVWKFISELGATETPDALRKAETGTHLAEVFPALALSALSVEFHGRLAGPRYNPERRKTFRLNDWKRVVRAVADGFAGLGLAEPALWCTERYIDITPKKADQDALDALICLLIVSRLRLGGPETTAVLGDTKTGYMVVPVEAHTRERLFRAASEKSVPLSILT